MRLGGDFRDVQGCLRGFAPLGGILPRKVKIMVANYDLGHHLYKPITNLSFKLSTTHINHIVIISFSIQLTYYILSIFHWPLRPGMAGMALRS